ITASAITTSGDPCIGSSLRWASSAEASRTSLLTLEFSTPLGDQLRGQIRAFRHVLAHESLCALERLCRRQDSDLSLLENHHDLVPDRDAEGLAKRRGHDDAAAGSHLGPDVVHAIVHSSCHRDHNMPTYAWSATL